MIQKTEGGTPGYIRPGATYRVFASATDTGNPASGVAAATADTSAVSTGQAAAPLSAGSFTVAGQSYNERSASLTANPALLSTTYGYTLRLTDIAGNAATRTGYSVVVDSVAPTGSNVQTANVSGGTAGRPELGDSITFTSSEQIDPNSVLAGWTGSATSVVVRITSKSISGNDGPLVYNAPNTTTLPLGSVNLGRSDYVSASATFGATGTSSTMTQSGTAITVTLGPASSGPRTATGNGTMLWTPSAAATDRADNPSTVAAVTESGGSDKEF